MKTPLELRHLLTLNALAQVGTLSKAAEMLHVTQSALSHQLMALEAHYGGELFVRKSNPLRWTPIGERLLALAQTVLPTVQAAERDIVRLHQPNVGPLRIAVECHTCFDWLMPAMDAYRQDWPEVELDIVSGFHADPVGLLDNHSADFAILTEAQDDPSIVQVPLFRYEVVAVLANDHPLGKKAILQASDFAKDTLITYPVPESMLDIYRQLLQPAGIAPAKRTAQLTVALLQLVASRRGIAALPAWAVESYVQKQYIQTRRITKKGLYATLYVAIRQADAEKAYLQAFAELLKQNCVKELIGIELL
ncbi:LysR family transcriptional regulator [Parvibium lacunae]|uniref:HTH-type transcriptional regulator MetR n=1 Tax=Parvibium lacunae TaxID=1888893 RepID=A0A368KZG4_9BURK|nr:LysR family transcriptional regulator [Parvibium lacunae]